MATPLWNSGIPGNLGILGSDVAEPPLFWWLWLHPSGIPEFREIWEFWEEMSLSRHYSGGCGCTPLWNSGIPGNLGILGRDVAEPSGPSGIPEFREIWEFWEEMSHHCSGPSGTTEFQEFWEEMSC